MKVVLRGKFLAIHDLMKKSEGSQQRQVDAGGPLGGTGRAYMVSSRTAVAMQRGPVLKQSKISRPIKTSQRETCQGGRLQVTPCDTSIGKVREKDSSKDSSVSTTDRRRSARSHESPQRN